MQNQKSQSAAQKATRAEKLSVLSSLLDPEAMARLRAGGGEGTNSEAAVDAGRVAWHRNKLLERLRAKGATGEPSTRSSVPSSLSGGSSRQAVDHEPVAERKPQINRARVSVDTRLASNLDRETLAREHPAVIARLLNAVDRPMRIEALKSLPGPVARTVVRRLRDL